MMRYYRYTPDDAPSVPINELSTAQIHDMLRSDLILVDGDGMSGTIEDVYEQLRIELIVRELTP